MLAEANQGIRKVAAGVLAALGLEPYGGLVVQDMHGRYTEACRAGRIFHTVSKGVTVAATHNTPITAATATPVLGLKNPASSGKALVLLRASVGTVSGTPAGGQFVLNTQAEVANLISATITGTVGCGFVKSGQSTQGAVAQPLHNVALTGWTAVAAVFEQALLGSAAAVAATGHNGPGSSDTDLQGAIIVPPGGLVAIMAGTGAGTSWIVNASLSWEEVDYPFV